LPIFTAAGDLAATIRAISIDAASSPSRGTTRLTSPISAARAAGRNSPSSSISIASLRGTLRLRATIGVEQKSPMLTPEVAKRASSEATARSQEATSWHPAAVAIPLTSAITGCGSRTTRSIVAEHLAKSSWK